MKVVSVKEMLEMERKAMEKFHISQETLMENAGRAVAEECLKFMAGKKLPKSARILTVCGGGNNGGDGFVASRILKEKGWDIKILLLKRAPDLKDAALKNLERAQAEKIFIEELPPTADMETLIRSSNIIIDAILGTGFKGKLKEPYKTAILQMNASGVPIIAVDVPSGLDADTGAPEGTAVQADLTMTMGALKKGFLNPVSRNWTGKVIVADIGFPKELIPPSEDH